MSALRCHVALAGPVTAKRSLARLQGPSERLQRPISRRIALLAIAITISAGLVSMSGSNAKAGADDDDDDEDNDDGNGDDDCDRDAGTWGDHARRNFLRDLADMDRLDRSDYRTDDDDAQHHGDPHRKHR